MNIYMARTLIETQAVITLLQFIITDCDSLELLEDFLKCYQKNKVNCC